MSTAAKQQVTKVAETPEAATAAAAKPREVPPLKSTALEWQHEGQVYREAFVRLPAGVILQDLQDSPGIWRGIQGVPSKALHAFDRVTCVAFDTSWIVKDVLVADADANGVKLAIRPQDVIRLQAQAGTWADDRHEIKWAGSGYGAFRKLDGVEVLSAHFSSVEAAKSELFRQHYMTRR